ncbi:MAG TPA: PaaX family transcriptional regulator C-terminal domain-containing protein [Pseudonocardiaceae bacterium]|nr:PaaX family transcriptional regulator C-terminal domain-containing protein [Pseudonocardiaceae bacterium]
MQDSDTPPVERSAVRLPVAAGSARSMLLTVLAELVYPNREPVWTSALLRVLAGVGIEPQTGRQAIARTAAAGWITAQKRGREVRWELTDRAVRLIEDGAARVYSLHSDDRQWDGRWLILFVTIADAQRTARKRLYSALSWEGFGNPTPGVWLSPHPDRESRARRVIEDLGLADSTLAFIGTASAIGLTEDAIVAQAWDLSDVATRYEQLLIRYSGLKAEPGDAALYTHIRLVNEWQRFPFLDPQLPEKLVPDWIGRRAARIFYQSRSAGYEAAQLRWREIASDDAAV